MEAVGADGKRVQPSYVKVGRERVGEILLEEFGLVAHKRRQFVFPYTFRRFENVAQIARQAALRLKRCLEGHAFAHVHIGISLRDAVEKNKVIH